MTAFSADTNGPSSSTISENSTSSSALPNIPASEALSTLLSPDGYYTYLNIPKPPIEPTGPKYPTANPDEADNAIDIDVLKKNYRKLSLKHHPDRKSGDAETFRILTRAKIVLSSPKLRREYDLVGLDLDDAEEEGEHHQEESDEGGDDVKKKEEQQNSGGGGSGTKTETVMGHLASATLAGVLQMVVRTLLMAFVSVVLSRYMVLAILAILLLCFLSARIFSALKQSLPAGTKLSFATLKETLSPLVIAFGVFCMYRGRRFLIPDSVVEANNVVLGDSTNMTNNDAAQNIAYASWSWTFWLGETVVMTCFLTNSFEKRNSTLVVGFAVISLLLSLLLRGQFWRYATLLGFQGAIALLVVLAFPVMEMVLEEIVQEKMRKVGEKIRAHDARVKEMLKKQAGH